MYSTIYREEREIQRDEPKDERNGIIVFSIYVVSKKYEVLITNIRIAYSFKNKK